MAPKKAQNLLLQLHAEGLTKADARVRLKTEHGYKPSRISQLMKLWPSEGGGDPVEEAHEPVDALDLSEEEGESNENQLYEFPSAVAAAELLEHLPDDEFESMDSMPLQENEDMEESVEDEEACTLMLLAA